MHSSSRPSLEQQIERLTKILQQDYDARCDPAEIDHEVRRQFEDLCREARIKDFIPILVERRVRAILNDRAGSRSATPEPLLTLVVQGEPTALRSDDEATAAVG